MHQKKKAPKHTEMTIKKQFVNLFIIKKIPNANKTERRNFVYIMHISGKSVHPLCRKSWSIGIELYMIHSL